MDTRRRIKRTVRRIVARDFGDFNRLLDLDTVGDVGELADVAVRAVAGDGMA